ncbi:MAG: hypothetical protein M2R45_04217 [Verrucomicrobia subdivision 3 bacterium]|nr:hypothetical protein [Limisphaerales bacterium]MCS1417046.1 hypothetical protein [Limisphaerales bacterium]
MGVIDHIYRSGNLMQVSRNLDAGQDALVFRQNDLFVIRLLGISHRRQFEQTFIVSDASADISLSQNFQSPNLSRAKSLFEPL